MSRRDAGLLCLLVCLVGVEAFAQSSTRPFWTEQAMFRFGDDLYFIGVASCAKSAEEGRQKAFASGMQELGAYARERDTSRLLVDTAMIFEETNASTCGRGTVSVWRLLRVKQESLVALPRRKAGSTREDNENREKPEQSSVREAAGLPPPPSVRDLTPQVGMSREAIAERFGTPMTVTKQGLDEVWDYGDTGLTITFSPHETLVSWALSGKPDPPSESSRSPDLNEPAMTAHSAAEQAPIEPVKPVSLAPPMPLPRNPVEEGRKLFNRKGACNTCHGRDADMYTDVTRDEFFGLAPGYLPPVIGPFYGPSPRRVAPDLRDWSSLRIRTDLDLYRAIKNGIGGSTMTGTRHLSDAEISDLIAYLNSLR